MTTSKRFLHPAAWSVVAVLAAFTQAQAAENGTLAYPIGAPGIYAGVFPPFPGLYALSQTAYTSADALYGANGKKLPVPFELDAYSETIRILAAYEAKFLGASVYSQLVLTMAYAENRVFGAKQSGGGAGNVIITPFVFDWTIAPFQHVSIGLDLGTEFSSYSPSTFTVANGYTTVMPVFGYCYCDPNGLEVAISPRLLFNAENDDTNYRSGNAFVVDFAAGWHFNNWLIGVVGGYGKQFTADRQNGIDIGNEFQQLKLGPSVAYRSGPVTISFNWQPSIYVENGSNASSFWLNIAAPLWVPPR